jgi:CheY-like chemotaxis protein
VILLVDDNRESSEALAEFLSREGHAVQRAANGSEALRLLADFQTRPNAGTRWLGISRRAKQGPNSRRRSSRDNDVVEKAKEAGAVAFVRKPIEPRTLFRLIEHFAERV